MGVQFSSAIWRVTVSNLLHRRLQARICSWPIMWKYNASIKPEVHNVLHCHQRRTEPWPTLTCTENFTKFGCVYEICRQTDRPTNIQPHWLQYFISLRRKIIIWDWNPRSCQLILRHSAHCGHFATEPQWWHCIGLAFLQCSLLFTLLWSPYVIGQTIIFSTCFFFFLLLLLFFLA